MIALDNMNLSYWFLLYLCMSGAKDDILIPQPWRQEPREARGMLGESQWINRFWCLQANWVGYSSNPGNFRNILLQVVNMWKLVIHCYTLFQQPGRSRLKIIGIFGNMILSPTTETNNFECWFMVIYVDSWWFMVIHGGQKTISSSRRAFSR